MTLRCLNILRSSSIIANVNLFTRRATIAVVVLTFALAGCGKSHKSESTATTNTTPTTVSAGANGAVATPTPQSSDPDVVGSGIDSSLNDINSDLSSIDSAPSDEGDPTS